MVVWDFFHQQFFWGLTEFPDWWCSKLGNFFLYFQIDTQIFPDFYSATPSLPSSVDAFFCVTPFVLSASCYRRWYPSFALRDGQADKLRWMAGYDGKQTWSTRNFMNWKMHLVLKSTSWNVKKNASSVYPIDSSEVMLTESSRNHLWFVVFLWCH